MQFSLANYQINQLTNLGIKFNILSIMITKKILIILACVAILFLTFRYGLYFYTKSFSPEAKATYQSKDLKIEVDYCRPSKKGRIVFGNLVSYDEVWRTGANECTEISFNKDLLFGGKEIKAGKYALFTIPHKDYWTVILNHHTGQWGAFQYRDDQDALRVEVPVYGTEKVSEIFTIQFKEIGREAEMQLTWDKTLVSIPIEKK
jgi:hypothetical protein